MIILQKQTKNKQFMINSLYFSFAINIGRWAIRLLNGSATIMHHVQSSISQQSFTLFQVFTASQSWAVLTDQATEAEDTD